MRFAVFGGANMDIIGAPAGDMRLRDSNIGSVALRPGGVGRNIAQRLAAMGAECALFTVLGTDALSAALAEDCARRGIDIGHALRVAGRACVYLCVQDETGDMLAAVNDMAPAERLDAAYARAALAEINRCDLCVLDANARKDALDTLATGARVPLLLDMVSCEKALRALDALPHLAAVKPNLPEARAVTGRETPRDCAQWLLDKGVRRVFLSLGADGLYYADASGAGQIPVQHPTRAAKTGAGDALCAGIALAMARGESTRACAESGMQSAAAFLGEQETADNFIK